MNIRIENYDKYVKEFKEKCINKNLHPYSKTELKIMTEKACAGNKIPDVEELERLTLTLKGEDSIDGEKHYFCFKYKTEEGTVVIHYQLEG